MRTRLFKDSDYEMVQKWWVASGCPPVSLSQLQTIGLIGYTDENEPACALWAYRSKGVGVAFLEHLITSPKIVSPMKKIRAMHYMVDHLIDILQMDGYQMIRACTWSDTFAKACQKRWGFQLIGGNYNNLSLIV
jgi:hypothetical protein